MSKTLLAVGTYTKKEDHVDGKGEGVYLYNLNQETGEFNRLSTTSTINPTYLAFSTSGKFLYVVQETGSECGDTGFAIAYKIEEDSTLTLLNTVPTHGFSPCHIVIDKLDRYAFISNYMGKFVMIALEPNGHFGNTTHILDFDKIESSNSRQDSSHPHSIILSPDERFCYFQDLGTDKIMVFEVDYQNGKFVPIQEVSIKPGAGPRHFVFHPLIPFAYCINELDSTITSFSFDKETGKLTIFENVPTIPSEYDCNENWPSDIHITPDGRYLYGANRDLTRDGSLVIYQVDLASGKLSFVGYQPTHGTIPRSFLIDSKGKFVFVANQNTDSIVTFKIEEDGKLTFLRSVEVLTPRTSI